MHTAERTNNLSYHFRHSSKVSKTAKLQKLNRKLTFKCPLCTNKDTWTFYLNTRKQSVSTNSILAEQRTLHTKFTSRMTTQSTGKKFKIPEAHRTFIEATLDVWLKLGVVKRTNSLYNSSLYCVSKNKAPD